MKHARFWSGLLLVGALGLGGLVVGCESTETQESSITITSDAADDEVQLGQITFTAALASTNDVLVLPLTWSVEKSALGRFLASDGVSAVYEAFDDGVQAIHVTDQIGRKGVKGITQLPPAALSTNGAAATP